MMVQTDIVLVMCCFYLCRRGTHIRNTAEIGPVTIAKIENKGRQNRRIIVAFAD